MEFRQTGSMKTDDSPGIQINTPHIERDNCNEINNSLLQLINLAGDMIFIHDFDIESGPGRITEVNNSAVEKLGYSREEILKMTVRDLISDNDLDNFDKISQELALEKRLLFEAKLLTKDGKTIPIEVHSRLFTHGDTQKAIAIVRDITERAMVEFERETTSRLLHLLNQPIDFRDIVKLLITSLQHWSGCEAVGIRLREGEDYPCYETVGFPEDFVRAESSLCCFDSYGQIVRNEKDQSVLECTCGNIISGRFDPALPYFTEWGSFWTNDLSEYIASIAAKSDQTCARGLCNKTGYKSMALIPLRAADETYGLLQFNDFEPGKFTLGKISLLERLANNLAFGLGQRRIAEELRKSEKRFRRYYTSDPLLTVTFEYTTDGFRLVGYNQKVYEATKGRISELISKRAEHIFTDNEELTKAIHDCYQSRKSIKQRINFESKLSSQKGDYEVTLVYIPPNSVILRGEDISEQIKARKDLEESEARYRQLVEDVNDLVYSIDKEGNLTFLNSAIKTKYGYDPEEVIGHNYREFIYPDDIPATEKHVSDALSGDVYVLDYRIVAKDGTLHWVSSSPRPIIVYGEFDGLNGILTDISDRKVFEEKIRTRLESLTDPGKLPTDINFGELLDVSLLQNLFDRLSVALGLATAIIDTDENVITASKWQDICTRFHRSHPETCKRCKESDAYVKSNVKKTGYAEYRCANGLWDFAIPIKIGERHIASFFFGQLFLAEDLPDMNYFKEQARQFGFDEEEYLNALKKVPIFSRRRLEDIMNFCRGLVTLLVSLGSKNIGQAQAIAQRDKAEKELRANEEKYRTYVNNSPAAIIILDDAGKIVDVNDAACRLFQYSREEVLGPSNNDFHIESDYKLNDTDFQFLKNTNKLSTEKWLRRKDGSKILCAVDGTALNDNRFLIFCLDKTEKKALQEQLQQSLRMETVGQLAGGVAHDFNNMLSPILGYADLMLGDPQLDDEYSEQVQEIRTAAERSRDLIQQLLAFGRKQILSLKTIDLGDVIRGLEKLLSRTTREDINLSLQMAGQPCPIMADRNQLEQVLINLVINARDAMPDGGKITISLADRLLNEDDLPSFPDLQPGRFVEMVISDTGHGMDDETIQHIFEPFYTTKGVNGTGLGLSTVYGIVKQHNGGIKVISNLNKGTTFTLLFPYTSSIVEVEENRSTVADYPIGEKSVMVVEDNGMVRRMVCRILERQGYNVIPASDGIEALAIFKECREKPDLFIVDVIMPNISGQEFSEKIYAAYPEARILFMSGYTDDVIGRHGVLDSGIKFIQKPFTQRDLVLKIGEIFGN